MHQFRYSTLLVSFAMMFLSACGSGGGGSNTPSSSGVTIPQSTSSSSGGGQTSSILTNKVRINEISTRSDESSDWIELYNLSDDNLDLSGASLRDNDDTHSYVFPNGTNLGAGRYMVIERDEAGLSGFDFGLGSTDAVRFFDADMALIDSTSWEEGNTSRNSSWGRSPNGSGEFTTHTFITRGTENPDISGENRLADIRSAHPEYQMSDTDNADYIFDQDNLRRYDLWLEDSALEFINADPAAEAYVEGALVFEGKVISAVGIRYKGSIGAFVGCVAGNNWINPTGAKTCTKLSMKVKLNWNDQNARFYGLKKLQFHSQNLDTSKMRERLGYYLFREFGVPAPKSVHALLYINGEYNGVFALTEQIDGSFANDHFADTEGNVYKEVWPVQGNGVQTPNSQFIAALKTNEEAADVSNFEAFANDIARIERSMDSNSIDTIMRSWFDIDQLMRTVVVDRAIAHDDGMYHWYCGAGNDCNNHNYYWYQGAETHWVNIIPWDLDNAFENLGEPKNGVTYVEDAWDEVRNNCNAFLAGALNIPQRSAACDKLMHAFTIYHLPNRVRHLAHAI